MYSGDISSAVCVMLTEWILCAWCTNAYILYSLNMCISGDTYSMRYNITSYKFMSTMLLLSICIVFHILT